LLERSREKDRVESFGHPARPVDLKDRSPASRIERVLEPLVSHAWTFGRS